MFGKLLITTALVVIALAALPSSRLRNWGRRLGIVMAALLLLAAFSLSVYGLVYPEAIDWFTGPQIMQWVDQLLQEAQEQPKTLWILVGVAAVLAAILNGLWRRDAVRPPKRIETVLRPEKGNGSIQRGHEAMRNALQAQISTNGTSRPAQKTGSRIDELLSR